MTTSEPERNVNIPAPLGQGTHSVDKLDSRQQSACALVRRRCEALPFCAVRLGRKPKQAFQTPARPLGPLEPPERSWAQFLELILYRWCP